MREIINEIKNSNFEETISFLQKLNLNLKVTKNEIKVLVESNCRSETMLKIRTLLEPVGFVFSDTHKSSIGVIKKIDRKKGSVYVYVKPIAKNAAIQGFELEKEYCKILESKYKFLNINVESAGASDRADININKADKNLSIELKKNVGSDYGQFGIVYDLKKKIWLPNETKNYCKNKSFIDEIFFNEINQYLDCFCTFEGFSFTDFIVKQDKIKGISKDRSAHTVKQDLQKLWFGNHSDFCLDIDKKLVSRYYSLKGNKFIQIENMGLYDLTDDCQYVNIPSFFSSIKRSYLRFRIKSHGGKNSRHSFTIAIKLDLEKSQANLLDQSTFASIIKKEFL